ncbi:hypothetical protein CERSUDRAFT_111855 [Gelatoporia subvermispora B]|uniref:Uncharacterized protein n=1 Tax=Ceriporiopsis subvermispora (strain B) TaxID=914234 RepID=M2RL45_CERS8|nr:hypothetical protein CERSUDRAFT_111855 [Gelatoporia subvermispora B]
MHTDNSQTHPACSLTGPASSSSFFDWRNETDIPPPASPASPLSPSSPSSVYSQSSEPEFESDALTWSAAAADARDGIHYIQERWPAKGSTYISPLYAHDHLAVRGGERVRIVQEVNEYTLRVARVAPRAGEPAAGLIPAWNVEGALERLARLNMAFNEAVTCPAESDVVTPDADAPTAPAAAGLRTPAHVHERCVRFSAPKRGAAILATAAAVAAAAAVSASSGYASDSDSDSDSDSSHSGSPSPSRSPVHDAGPAVAVYDAGSPLMGAGLTLADAKKSVVFAADAGAHKLVFRYPSGPPRAAPRRPRVRIPIDSDDEREEEPEPEPEEIDEEWRDGWVEPVGLGQAAREEEDEQMDTDEGDDSGDDTVDGHAGAGPRGARRGDHAHQLLRKLRVTARALSSAAPCMRSRHDGIMD